MKQILPFSKTAEHDLRIVEKYGKHSFFLKGGKEIFDAQSGNGAFPLGFQSPEIIDYVANRMGSVPFVRANNATTSDPILELNQKFTELSKGKFKFVFYGLSGSDSIETALKMALVYWRTRASQVKRKLSLFCMAIMAQPLPLVQLLEYAIFIGLLSHCCLFNGQLILINHAGMDLNLQMKSEL